MFNKKSLTATAICAGAAAALVGVGVSPSGNSVPVAQAAAPTKHLSGLRFPAADRSFRAISDATADKLPAALAAPDAVSPVAAASGATVQAFVKQDRICISIRLADGAGGAGCGRRDVLDTTTVAAPIVLQSGDGFVVAGLAPDGMSSVGFTAEDKSELRIPVSNNVFVAETKSPPAQFGYGKARTAATARATPPADNLK